MIADVALPRSREFATLAASMRPLTALLWFVLLAALHTWPLSGAPWRESLNYNADAEHAAWTVSWIAHVLPADPLRLFDGNIFAPERATLTYSDPLIVPGVLVAPVRWLGGSAVLAFNLAMLLGLVLTAWSGWFVAWRWTGAAGPALVAGALTAFNPHVLSRLPHLMAAHVWGVPLTLYFADRLIDRPNRRDAGWLAAVVAATAATSLYWLALAGIVVGVVIAAGLVTRRWRGAVAAGAASMAGLVIASPILWPYLRFAAAGATRPIELAAQFSATPAGYLTATSRLHSGWSATFFRDEVNVFFAGAAAIVLAALGVIVAARDAGSRRRVWILAALAVIGVVLSLGPSTGLYRWLYEWLPPLHGLRAPARFGYLYLLAIAMTAAFGLQALTARWPTPLVRTAITGVAIAISTAEVTQAPIRTAPFDRVPPIYGFVSGLAEPVVLVEAPFFPADAVFENGEYQLNATAHWRPLMNGTSGFTPMSYRRRAAVFWFFPQPGTVEAMKHEGATHLMVHLDRFDAREAELVRVALFERPDLRLLAADGRGHRLYAIR